MIIANYYRQDFATLGYTISPSFHANIDKALNVTGTAANPVCVSGPPCVPYNIFTDGGVTQEQVDYLSLNGTARGTSTLRTIHGDITGDLGE